MKLLAQRHIQIEEGWPGEKVPSCIAEFARRRRGEKGYLLRSENKVGTYVLNDASHVGGATVAVCRWQHDVAHRKRAAVNGEWPAALEDERARHLPSSD